MHARAHLRYAMISASIAAVSTVALYCLGWIMALLFAHYDYMPISATVAESRKERLFYQSFGIRPVQAANPDLCGATIRECWAEYEGIATYNSTFTGRLRRTENLRLCFTLNRPMKYGRSAYDFPRFHAVYDGGLPVTTNYFVAEQIDGADMVYVLRLPNNQIPSVIAYFDSSGNRVLDFSCTPSE